MLGNLTYDEDLIVDRALLETYAKKDITPDSDLSKIEAPVMSDLEQILEAWRAAPDLALRLRKFTEGTFAGLLNNQTNVEMANQLVCFSVRDLEDELRPDCHLYHCQLYLECRPQRNEETHSGY